MSLMLISNINILYAQNNSNSSKSKKEEQQEPIDMPETIIKVAGASNNIRIVEKSYPKINEPLSKTDLDSINSIEKKQSLLLPNSNLPTKIISPDISNFFVKAALGMNTALDAEAAYGFDVLGFDIYSHGGINFQNEHVKNSDYISFFGNAYSDYIADKKFFIFGGSKTRTEFNINNLTYSTYGIETPQDRNLFEINADIHTDGNYNGFKFQTGIALNNLTIASDTSASDRSLYTFIRVLNPLNNFDIGFDVDLDLRAYNSNNSNFMNILGFLNYHNNKLSLQLKGGFQTAGTSYDIARNGLLLNINSEYRINNNFTFGAKFRSGLEKNTFNDYIRYNPYLKLNAMIDHTYNKVDFNTYLLYHPTKDLGLSISGNYKTSNRVPIITNNINELFEINYINGDILSLNLETYYNFNQYNTINIDFKINSSNQDSTDKEISYIAPTQFSTHYLSKLTDKLNLDIGIEYVGKKYVNLQEIKDGENRLEGYFDISAKVNYRFYNNLSIFVRMQNLTNSDIYLWNGYKERGIFINAGILWKL